MLSVTADTNVYVGALAFGGKALQIVEIAAQGLIRLSISDAILQETIRVLGGKFRWEDAALREVDALLRSIAEVVVPTQAVERSTGQPCVGMRGRGEVRLHRVR